jgi:hypothetical protein
MEVKASRRDGSRSHLRGLGDRSLLKLRSPTGCIHHREMLAGMLIMVFKDIRSEGSSLQHDRCTARAAENPWTCERKTTHRRCADVSAINVHPKHL